MLVNMNEKDEVPLKNVCPRLQERRCATRMQRLQSSQCPRVRAQHAIECRLQRCCPHAAAAMSREDHHVARTILQGWRGVEANMFRE